MRLPLLWFSAALLAAAPAVGQTAGARIDHVTVDAVATMLRDKGYKAEIVRKEGNTPYVMTGMSGRNINIFFYDCTGESCGSLQFSMVYTTDPRYTVALANRWNQEQRYAKAYIDKQNQFNFEWDVDLNDGVMPDHVRTAAAHFERLVGEFSKFE